MWVHPNKKGNILIIDRTKKFDIEKFFGKGWSIWWEDERSRKITTIDDSKIDIRNADDSYTLAEWWDIVHSVGGIAPLDAKVFEVFWDDLDSIPKALKQKKIKDELNAFFFPGTIICSPKKELFMLYIFCLGEVWTWSFSLIDIRIDKKLDSVSWFLHCKM